MTSRRLFLQSTVAAGSIGVGALLGGTALAKDPVFEVTHTEAEWRKILSRDAYQVLREEATEPPGYSPLDGEKRKGRYDCGGCDLPVFSSTTKFHAGTGWPSFWKPLDNAVVEKRDTSAGMIRIAVYCRRCGGHLGHVFDDGPRPTGLRYCINGVALKFVAA